MPFNGSGQFNRVRNWVSDAAAAIKIRADYHDQEDDGFAQGLSNCIARDGQSTISADIPWNGKKITNLGAPVNPNDAATKAVTDGKVAKVGDTMTGSLTIAPASGTAATVSLDATGAAGAALYLDKGASGQACTILASMNSKTRWALAMGNSTAETGSNVGSDFFCSRYDDAGVYIDAPLTIGRSTGNVGINTGNLTVAGQVTAGGQVTSSQNFASSTANLYLATTGAGQLVFRPNGLGSTVGQATLNAGGNLTVDNLMAAFHVTSGATGVNVAAGDGAILWNDGRVFSKKAGTAASNVHFGVYNNALATPANVGSISSNGSATSFNTSSDENLKTFIGPYDPAKAIAIIRADPVRDFTWNVDGEYAVGWGAQTSHAVSPDLATPPSVVDAVRAMRALSGDKERAQDVSEPTQEEIAALPKPGEPGYSPWGMDQAKRTPYLWAALSWALDQIDILNMRVAALETPAP